MKRVSGRRFMAGSPVITPSKPEAPSKPGTKPITTPEPLPKPLPNPLHPGPGIKPEPKARRRRS